MPSDFTFSFWLMLIDDSTDARLKSNFDVINAFGRIYVTANLTGGYGSLHRIEMKLIENQNGQSA